jgi:hypothetical protein
MKAKFNEGPAAQERFERTMVALFNAPKTAKAVPKKRASSRSAGGGKKPGRGGKD